MTAMQFAVLMLVAAAAGRGRARAAESSFIGRASGQLSTALLQGYMDDADDVVFSPLGYSAILAILAEGARGETKQQLVAALRLPDDEGLVRKSYRFIMERLKYTDKFEYNKPELQNYFYVYKNYSIDENYKKILQECYLTDVRSVERYSGVEDDSEGKGVAEIEPPTTTEDEPQRSDFTETHHRKPVKNIKEQIKFVKHSKEEATTVADEARNHDRNARVLMRRDDIASSMSVNGVGKKEGDQESPSIMIIFNGMYFRGSWKRPFDVVEPGLFYKSNSEKKQVTMLKTRGRFLTGTLPELDSEAVLIPYDGERYALLVLKPRARDGLARLVADLPADPFADIEASLLEEDLQLTLPSFYVSATTKPAAALAKFGVSRIFGREAELAGISAREGLFVQELVQNVVVRVDDTNSSAAFVAAGEVAQPKSAPPRRFAVQQPFVFFVVDCADRLVLVAGQVRDPRPPADHF